MEGNQNYKIVDGVFTPAKARDILLTMINGKINHHVKEGFSSTIRDGIDLSLSEYRIMELEKMKEHILTIIDQAEIEKQNLQIKGTIEISYQDRTETNE